MKSEAEVKNLKRIGNRWLVDISERIAGPKKADGHFRYQRHRIQFDSRKAALVYLNRRHERRLLGHLGIKQDDQPVEIQPVEGQADTFESFSKRFLELHSSNGLRANTLYGYAIIQRALVPFFGSKRLSDITAEHLEDWKGQRLTEIKPSSVNREIVFVKMVFKKALEFGKITRDPSVGLKMNREPATKIQVLTAGEVATLIDKAADHLGPIIRVLVSTGLRKTECLQLRWAYSGWERNDRPESVLDIAGRRIVVKASLAKSHKERMIPLDAGLIDLFKGLGERPGQRPFPFGEIKRSFQTASKKAGLGTIKLHWLRHTAASVMLNDLGIDVLTVKELLGHASLDTALRYLHKKEDNLKLAVSKMNTWVSDGRPLDDTIKKSASSDHQQPQNITGAC